MQTETMDIMDVEAHFKDVLHRVAGGVHVVLCDNLKAVAYLAPVGQRTPGLHAGAITCSDDFDKVLPDSFWLGAQ